MRSSYSQFSQSQFFHSSFNAALFDGPVRLFFPQDQEALALKVYFTLIRDCPHVLETCRSIHKVTGQVVMVLLYPDTSSFQLSFRKIESQFSWSLLDEDEVVGVQGALDDSQISELVTSLAQRMSLWTINHLPSNDSLAPTGPELVL